MYHLNSCGWFCCRRTQYYMEIITDLSEVTNKLYHIGQRSRLYCSYMMMYTGADPEFQARGAHLKKLRRTEGGANNCGVFRVKNHDFKPKILFFPILGGGARRVRTPPPPGSAPGI